MNPSTASGTSRGSGNPVDCSPCVIPARRRWLGIPSLARLAPPGEEPGLETRSSTLVTGREEMKTCWRQLRQC
jgi:hypothetical protein